MQFYNTKTRSESWQWRLTWYQGHSLLITCASLSWSTSSYSLLILNFPTILVEELNVKGKWVCLCRVVLCETVDKDLAMLLAVSSSNITFISQLSKLKMRLLPWAALKENVHYTTLTNASVKLLFFYIRKLDKKQSVKLCVVCSLKWLGVIFLCFFKKGGEGNWPSHMF